MKKLAILIFISVFLYGCTDMQKTSATNGEHEDTFNRLQ